MNIISGPLAPPEKKQRTSKKRKKEVETVGSESSDDEVAESQVAGPNPGGLKVASRSRGAC